MDLLLHPSLLQAYGYLGAAAVVLFAAVISYKRINSQNLKKKV